MAGFARISVIFDQRLEVLARERVHRGVEATRLLLQYQPDTRVVALTSFSDG